jgi:tetratricopeptide (TPR) repeat protein
MSRQRSLALFAALAVLGCKDPETQAKQERIALEQAKLKDGRAKLAAGDPRGAADAFRRASAIAPEDPQALLSLAEAHEQAGNATAAILAIKQAAELMKGGATPELQRQLAQLYLAGGAKEEAIDVLVGLRDADQLSDKEILRLARMQTHAGKTEAAFATLAVIQRKRPDDPEAKVVEAETLLSTGKELLATKIMDRLLEANPNLASARILRARYFFNNGYADLAQQDLASLKVPPDRETEVAELKARIFTSLERYADAEAVLSPLLQKDGRNADVLAQLAELQLYLGKVSEAQALIDQALSIRPNFARALYVRGRVLESQGELGQAAETYGYALKSDATFAPVLSRMWRIDLKRHEPTEAMSALERLLLMNEATLEEKAALAELYAKSHLNLSRGRELITELLKRDPTNAHYLEINSALGKAPRKRSRSNGPIIIRGRVR